MLSSVPILLQNYIEHPKWKIDMLRIRLMARVEGMFLSQLIFNLLKTEIARLVFIVTIVSIYQDTLSCCIVRL